jgi:hypothetical protein
MAFIVLQFYIVAYFVIFFGDNDNQEMFNLCLVRPIAIQVTVGIGGLVWLQKNQGFVGEKSSGLLRTSPVPESSVDETKV